MACPACGATVPNDAQFCPQCGARVEENIHGSSPPDTSSTSDPQGDPSPAERLRSVARRDSDNDHEETLWEGSYSPQTMVGPYVLAGLVAVGSIVGAVFFPDWTTILVLLAANALLWLAVYLRYLYVRLGVRYRLTTQRFIHESGILRRTTDRIEVIDMDDITFEQGPIERLLGIGTIKVTSSDRTHPEIVLRGIDDVKRIATTMDEVRREERRRRGLHIESV
jgi:membrane protein YdbS with pleckstrin-like domain